MKKILLSLIFLYSISSFAQAEFPEGIQLSGNASTVNSTKLINQNPTTGTLDHINATSLPISTSAANALDLKVENSAGAIQGFAITDNGNGTVNIATGTAYLRTTNDPYAPLIKYVIPAVTNLALTDNANNFVLVDYNSGTPALTVSVSPGTVNTMTNSIAYVISRVGNTLDYINLVGQNVDANGKLRRRFLNSEGLKRASGAVLSGLNRNLVLTTGLYYSGLIEVPTPAFNTSTSGTFTQAYLNGGSWTRTTGNTQINNTQYSLAGVLTTMPSNDYRVDYVYILADNPSKMYVLLGNTTYNNIGSARLAPVPSDLPSELQFLGTRVGRIIIKKDDATMEVSSEFATIYQAGSAQLHNDLAGLNAGDFQHLTVSEKANLELKSNKQNSLAVDGTGIKYPTVDAVNNSIATKQETVDYSTVALWGDSLTAGTGATSEATSYPAQFSKLTGYKYYNGGVGGETSTQIKNRLLVATDKLKYSTIIWAGNNNYSNTTTVKTDIAEMVSALGHDRYLIVGLINGDYPDRYIGQSGYNAIVSINSDLSILYGARFVDMRSYLVSLYNPSIPQDVIDHNNDIIPSSIRTDQIHLTDFGQLSVANKILLSLSVIEGANKKSLDMRYATSLFASPPYIGSILKNRAKFTDVELSGRLDVGGNSIFSGNSTVNGNLQATNTAVSVIPFQIGVTGATGGWIWQNGGNPTARVLMKGYAGVTETIRFDPTGFNYFNSGNFALGTTVDNGNLLRVNGTSYFDGNMKAANTTVSSIPLQVGNGGANGGWLWQNGGSPTTRVVMKGYAGVTETIRFDPAGFNYFNSGNFGIKTSTDSGFGLDVNGTTRLQSTVTLGTAPTTSAGTYDFLTRNTSTGVVEKVLSSSIALASNSLLRTGDQTATGRKTFTSDNTTAGGITISNSKTTDAGLDYGLIINNSGTRGLSVNHSGTSEGIFAATLSSGTAIYATNFSTGVALGLRTQPGATGDLLNAELGKTKITSAGNFISDDITANGQLKLKSYTVATLPTGVQGAIAYVTDALSPTYLGTLTGGGTVKCPVFYNGTAWVSH